jgi:glycosyltransferase involved in cell wall biosynthesis
VSLSVSVALCTYNGASFIEPQLRSILSQSLLPDEIIVSDDGSTDETLALVKAVLDAHHGTPVSLRILTSDHPVGVTKNFERAVQACVGDVIALCDHDDVWHSNRLSAAMPAFESDPRLLFQHSDARLIDAGGVPLGVSLFQALAISSGERSAISGGRAFEAYIRRNLATGATVLFRRSLLEDAIPFPVEWVHDEWLAIVASAVSTPQLLEEELIDYRQHGGNQIWVTRPTLRYRIGRMLEPRRRRYETLAARSRVLLERLEGLPISAGTLTLAREKVRFEEIRSRLPPNRIRRIGVVLREYRAGSYTRLSSQGNLDIVRDMVQKA